MKACESQLPLQAREDLLVVFEDPKTSMQTACAALDLFVKRERRDAAKQPSRTT